jgi:hypothetical protein
MAACFGLFGRAPVVESVALEREKARGLVSVPVPVLSRPVAGPSPSVWALARVPPSWLVPVAGPLQVRQLPGASGRQWVSSRACL